MSGPVGQVRQGDATSAAVQGGYQQVNATPDAFGAGAGAALQNAGALVGKAADTMERTAIRMATEDNEATAKTADTAFNTTVRNTLFDPKTGYLNLKGQDATNAYKPTMEALQKAHDDAAGAIKNSDARRMFTDIATRRTDAALDTMAKHAAIERRTVLDGASIARASDAGNDAVAYAPDAARREAFLNVGRAEIIQHGADHGEAPEVTQSKLRDYNTKAYVGIVKRIAVDDPMAAKALYEANRDKIDGQQQGPMESFLKEATTRRQATLDANGVMGVATGTDTRDNNIGNIVKSEFKYSGGKGKGDGSFETFTSPEQGVAAAVHTIDAKAKQNGGAITPLELIGGNAKVKGWAPADDGKGDPLLKGNNPNAYAAVLAKAAGIGVNDPLPVNDPEKMAAILKAMNVHEHGKQTVPDAAYKTGLDVARGNTVAAAPTSTDPKARAREMEENLATYLDKAKAVYGNDPERLDKVNAEIKQRMAQQELVVSAGEKAATADAWKIAITPDASGAKPTSRDAIPPDLWIKLDPLHQRALEEQFVHNLKGRDPPPNPPLYAELSRQFVEDPDGFKNRDLVLEATKLPGAEWRHFQDLQMMMGKKDNALEAKTATLQKGLQISDALLKSSGIYMDYADKKGKVKDAKSYDDYKAQYQTALLQEMNQFQSEHKKAPNDDEIKKMADRLLIQGRLRGDNWFGADKAVRFQNPEKFYVPYSDIPADRRARMEESLAKRGMLPNVADTIPGNVPARDRQKAVEDAYTLWLQAGGK